ncbi:MAG: hypothetical protein JSU03_09000 [Bacteroidetes bacterium]|nr:hypothetical protein [Bacteroidota bacterium]
MDKSELSESKSFIVKESVVINAVAAFIFWVMFFYAIYYKEFSNSNPRKITILPYLTFIPAILFTIKATINKPIIEINSKGFYYRGSLITTWENFNSIKLSQDDVVGSISDNFVLFIEYIKPGYSNYFCTKLSLGYTQNKGEEDVIEATEFYYSKWKEKLS